MTNHEFQFRPNGPVRFRCEKCGGEGGYFVSTGYRQYGSGYGDCEETFEGRECDLCEGAGHYVIDYSPVEDISSNTTRKS